MTQPRPKPIMNATDMARAIKRMCHEIAEENEGTENLAVVGIHTRGIHLANRIAADLKTIEGIQLPVGALDIGLYRDDFHLRTDKPLVHKTDIPFDVTDKVIILVDDVMFTGRTIRAALDALSDLGRSKKIELAVLIDRGHRELPIAANFIGKKIKTSADERVKVRMKEVEGKDSVSIEGGTS